MLIHNVRDLMITLREGAYTSLGSYPKYWVTADGEVLSYKSVLKNVGQIARAIRGDSKRVDVDPARFYSSDAQWRVIGCDVNWEDPDLMCDHSGERIPSAYAEDQVVNPIPNVGKRTA